MIPVSTTVLEKKRINTIKATIPVFVEMHIKLNVSEGLKNIAYIPSYIK